MTFNIYIQYNNAQHETLETLSINKTQYKCQPARQDCSVVVMLSVSFYFVFGLNVVKPSVVVLNVIMPSVMASN